jgi:glycosyltransferase involved in cell wall biosynthesis
MKDQQNLITSVDISVIIIAMNEAHDIADTIASVSRWCREVIVFDSGSVDGTQALCRSLGAKVFDTDWPGDGPQKNRALAQATGEWVICLDADEQISEPLRREILETLPKTHWAAFSTPRLSSFCGRQMYHCGWWPDRIVRIFRRTQGRFTDVRTHTHVVVVGETGKLGNPILHRAIPEIGESLEKMNLYSTEGACSLFESGKQSSFFKAISHGFWAFLRTYVLRMGFLDGKHGFMLSVLNAEGTYYRYIKLWLMQKDTGA